MATRIKVEVTVAEDWKSVRVDAHHGRAHATMEWPLGGTEDAKVLMDSFAIAMSRGMRELMEKIDREDAEIEGAPC